MSLRSKIILLLFAVFCLATAMDHLVWHYLLSSTFKTMERQQAERDMDVCVDALRRETQVLTLLAQRWAQMPQLIECMVSGDDQFLRENLSPRSTQEAVFNAVYLCHSDGTVLWSRLLDSEGKPLPSPREIPADRLPAGHPLLRAAEGPLAGLLLTDQGLLLLAARPLLDPDDEQVQGMLVMGRLLSNESLQGLARSSRGVFRIWPIAHGGLPLEERGALANLVGVDRYTIREVGNDQLQIYTTLFDISGRKALLLRAEIPREITVAGGVAVRTAQIIALLAGCIILAVTWMLLQRVVVRPIKTVTDHAVAVGRSGDLKARLNLSRRDEIGALAREFDAMVQNLAESRGRMLDAAHHAGMAEIATEVLHNVGNALNSINVSGDMLAERLKQSHVDGLHKATELLGEHRDDLAAFFIADPRGGKLLDYLAALSHSLQSQHTRLRDEVETLRDKIHHIKDIIALQQSYAASARFAQEEHLQTILDDALSVHREAVERTKVQVLRQYQPLPALLCNRSKLMQVLVNLIKNALEAMEQTPPPPQGHQLSVRIEAVAERAMAVEIGDTGPGLSAEVAGRIFQYGFTTKASGHGFGLHFCANATAEMGGTIRLVPRPGQGGACFRIELPLDGGVHADPPPAPAAVQQV